VTEPASDSASISVRVIDGDTISLGHGQPNVRLVGFNAPETGTGRYATQSAIKAKLQSAVSANWSAAAARHFSKLHALASRRRKAPMLAISGVAAERFKSTAWMWARH